jgi:hypothetical protein
MTIENKVVEQINKIWTWEEIAPINEGDILRSTHQMKNSNWKSNEIIKSFWIDSLLKELKWVSKDYFRDALHRIISDKALEELRTWADSGKITTAQLVEIYELSGWSSNPLWFWAIK